MSTGYHLSRDILGLILLASGAAKLADLDRSAILLRSLGVNARAEVVMRAVATLEVVVGLAVFSGLFLLWVDLVACLLFVVFLFVMLVATRRAQGVRCRCFGALSSSAVGTKRTLLNAGYALLSVAVLGAHRTDLDSVAVQWGVAVLPIAILFAACCAVAAQAIDRTVEVRG